MAFLKQVYLRNDNNQARAAISNALISRIKDIDEGVADIARTTIEEIWFTALSSTKFAGQRDLDTLLHMRSHAALVIQTVDLGDNVAAVLEDLIKTLLTQSKQASENVQICKSLIRVFFEGILKPSDIPGEPSQSAILRTLTVFAKAAPKLFTALQLEHLETYAQNLTTTDDLDIYHFAVTILRYTMPVLPGIRHDFLRGLQKGLLGTVGKLPKSELTVVAPCLGTIETVLGGTDNLMRLVLSALTNVYNMRAQDSSTLEASLATKLSRYIVIVGQFGKACNFDQHSKTFKERFSWYKGKDVAGLFVEIICRFTSPKQPLDIRKVALAAVCEICSSFPGHFLRTDVVNAIETVFQDKQSELEEVLLTNLEEFFAETSSEVQKTLGSGVESGTQRLGNTYQATGYDTASASLSQRFLPEFRRIALSSLNEVAQAAARVVVHINTRGMAHPGDSGPSLVALETCPIASIAKVTFLSHKEQYTKHENVFEKGLVKAVQQAFEYQQSVGQNTTGFTGHPPVSKLHFFWEVLRIGKLKTRTKLFTNLCASLNFDPDKLRLQGNVSQHLLYVRFCVEAVAFFEFNEYSEVKHLYSCLEKLTAGTGTSVAQAIESEILQLQAPVNSTQLSANDPNMMVAEFTPMPVETNVSPGRLDQLAVSAQILSLLWGTQNFIKRLYSVNKKPVKVEKAKKGKKDEDKILEKNQKATRATNAIALTDAYLAKVEQIMGMPANAVAQRKMCIDFVELSNIDSEVKVASDEDADEELIDFADARSEVSFAESPRGKKRKTIDGGGVSALSKKRVRLGKSGFSKMDGEDEEHAWF